MNKIYRLLFLLLFIPAFGMENEHLPEFMHIVAQKDFQGTMYASPEQLIANHIQYPAFIKKELEKYPRQKLLNFRYGPSNNLLHGIVGALSQQKDSLEDFDQLIESYKPILTWLTKIGLDINDLNDNHDTPLMFPYKSQVIVDFKEQSNRIQPLIDFLEEELDANPSYFSLMPELRLCTRFLWNIITCKCCKYTHLE